MPLVRQGPVWGLLTTVLCLAVGMATAVNPQVGLLLAVGVVGAFALAAPPYAWALCALVAAITFKGLVTVGLLPSVATYLDIPLAWGALAAALMRLGHRSRAATTYLRWLAFLVAAVLIAWVMNPSEVLRPILYVGLLGEPFAIVGALLAEPPTPAARRLLLRVAVLSVAIQVPLAYLQFAAHSSADKVQGTLVGAGAGAHTMSAIVAVGAFWVLSKGRGRVAWKRLGLVAAMLGVLFAADAKQVIFALPLLALGVPLRGRRAGFAVRAVAAVVAIVGLVSLPAGQTAVHFLQKDRSGEGGKQAAAGFIWRSALSDPPSVIFGKGPAETVSRSAFMTTDLLLQPNSPIRVLHLSPAATAVEVQDLAAARSGGGTSSNSGLSSALGVFGDVGLFGTLAYLGLLTLTFLKVRRVKSPEAEAAAGGLAMFAVLGLVFDWWEQPPISVFIAVLAAVALTRTPVSAGDRSLEPGLR